MANITVYDQNVLVKLETPYTMIVSGQTGSGKADFVKRLIKTNTNLHSTSFKRIIYAYTMFQESLEELNVELVEGFPDNVVWSGEPTLLVLDDMMLELRNDVRLAALFTKMRHKNVSTIFITQNMYFQSQYATTITRNAQYLALFPNPRDNAMIETLGRQTFPLNKKFLSTAFAMATDQPFGYLFLDFKPSTPKDLRVRQNIFPSEQCYVYLPKS